MIQAILTRVAAFFDMTDDTWERHANPLSVWSRFPILPLLACAIWARIWIGWWALCPVVILIIWAWVNPRAFPAPKYTDSWASKSVLGERVLLTADAGQIPPLHRAANRWLTILPILGLPPLVYGLWVYDLGWCVAGLALTILPKVWFLDRMVWLYEDMAAQHAVYRAWLRSSATAP